MPDLQNTSRPTPGPSTPTKGADPLLSLPAPPITLDDATDLSQLSAEDIKARMQARQRDIKFRIEALKHEALTLTEDVNVGGRPLMDRIRERPLAAVGLALATGALTGLLWGLRKRSKRLPDPNDRDDVIRYHVATLIDAAALRVARGASADAALAAEVRKRPVVFVPNEDETRIQPPVTSRKQAADAAFKTAAGIAVKTAADMLTKRFTGHEEVFEAMADESAKA